MSDLVELCRAQAEFIELARKGDDALAPVAAALREAAAALERAERDTARLDWFDRANARLNEKCGTRYKWKVILNHNVARLMLGDMQIDMHDTDANGLPSCREAIDAARSHVLSQAQGEDATAPERSE